MKKSNKKGFTLVKLVIVIAVIAILAGVMIATFSNVVGDAKASADLQEIKAALDAEYYDFITQNGTPATLEINENSEFIAFSSLTFGSVPTPATSSTTSSGDDGSETKTTITFATVRESEKESYYGNGELLKKTTTVETKPSGEASFVPSGASTVYYDYAATITGKKGTEFRVILIVNQMVLENINNTLDDDKKLDDRYLGSFYLEQVND